MTLPQQGTAEACPSNGPRHTKRQGTDQPWREKQAVDQATSTRVTYWPSKLGRGLATSHRFTCKLGRGAGVEEKGPGTQPAQAPP